MGRSVLLALVPLLLVGSLVHLRATAAQEESALDLNAEIQKLKGWKDYLTSELDKCKAEAQTTQGSLQVQQQMVADYAAQLEHSKQSVAAAEARAIAAEANAAQANAKATESDTLASSYSQYYQQATTQVEQLKQEVAVATAKATEAEAKVAAHAAATDAANAEAAVLRKQVTDAVSEREALEARVGQLASATAKTGGLRGHAQAILDILVEEAAKHRDTAVNYANEKLPGFKAKVTDLHEAVSTRLPNVTHYVSSVDGELRPWLRRTLTSVPALKQYGEDPVVLQAVVYAIFAAPVLAALPVLSVAYRLVSRRPDASGSRGPEARSARRNKKKQG